MKFSRSTLFLFAVLALSGCTGSGDITDKRGLQDGFKDLLGFAPLTAPAEMKGHWVFVRDNFRQWLFFVVDEETLQIVATRGEPKKAEFDGDAPGMDRGANTPRWWSEDPKLSLEFYVIDRSKPTETDYTKVWFDRKTRAIYLLRNVVH